MSDEPRVAAIILAAGLARRFAAPDGGSKLVAIFDGQPLVRHAVEAAIASRADPVVVVVGHAARDVQAALSGLDVTFAPNADYVSGLASSLRVGVAALPPGIDGVVVLLGDMPRIRAPHIDALIAAFALQPSAAAVVPVYDGQRGNPVLLARSLFAFLRTLSGDVGAKKILAQAGDRVIEMPIPDPAFAADVDTPEALAHWSRGLT